MTKKAKNKIREALDYHQHPRPGKIEVVPTKPHTTQRDLALAYSPGVAEPCLAIEEDVRKVYDYTSKGNLVAVISNGTAVLGLGDIGALASKPVMEGKGLLFKIFADIDVFDIEVDEKDPDKFIEVVKSIAPTFGGINLEDIKAPEAFYIEKRLKEELDIPVMHDDQHGTAIISGAALVNALELADKDISKVKIVVNGAGAAAISCTQIYVSLGAKKENILMLDSKGVITKDRWDELSEQKREFAADTKASTLEEALKGADVFIGLSKGNIVSADMLMGMTPNPIVFAMANPVPEIDYKLAVETRDDVIMATGRSDYPNQVNNVLGFPFIFRGALDVRATKINQEMKIAAVKAIAALTKEVVPQEVSSVYNLTNLSFGREYIIPKPFDPRLVATISTAVAKAAIESGVAQNPITDWEAYTQKLEKRTGVGNEVTKILQNLIASHHRKMKVVFPEADQYSVLKAAEICQEEGIATPVLLGRKQTIQALIEDHEVNIGEDVEIYDPKSDEDAELKQKFADKFWEKMQRKGITQYDAQALFRERNYFASMMVETGMVDAMVTGYSRSYAKSVKPIFDVIGVAESSKKAVGMMVLITKNGPLFLADMALISDPTVEEVAEITRSVHKTIKWLGIDPKIALLSYSTMGSSTKGTPKKMSDAAKILHNENPEIVVDGEFQADIALSEEKLKERFPFSKLAGHRANTLIFPNLESANITYRMLMETANCEIVGPILVGTGKPVHVVQMGSKVREMVNMVMVAAADAIFRDNENR